MDPTIDSLFSRIEADRAALVGEIRQLDDSAANRPPEGGGWSIVQVVHHLAIADELSIGYIAKKIQGGEALPRAGWGGRLRTAALVAALRSPFRFTAPSRSGDPPAGPLGEALDRWDAARSTWREVLEGFPPELLDRAVFRHPRAGMQTVVQALRFVDEHQRRHFEQIRRLAA